MSEQSAPKNQFYNLIKPAQSALFGLGSLFLLFSMAQGLASYNGISFDLLKSFADASGVNNPTSIEFRPAGSANLEAMENNDYFEAVAYDNTGVILKNITLDVQYSFTPAAGGQAQKSEVASWATQDDNGISLHQVTSTLAPGTYTLTAVRDHRLTEWQNLNGPSVTVAETTDNQATGELRGKTSIDGKYVRDPQGGSCADEYVLSGVVISYIGPVNGSIVQATCSESSKHPIYSVPNLPVGNYQVSITVPDGYEVIGAGSVGVSILANQETVQIFQIRKKIVPVETATGELRGKTSFKNLFIRDPSGPACSSEYVLDGVVITYSGPESGTLVQNQCSVSSGQGGHPVFSKKLPVGKYQVSISAPKGWVIEGSSSDNIEIKKDQETVQIFNIRKKDAVPVPTGISLTLVAVKPADLSKLRASDQYQVKAKSTAGKPLSNQTLDVSYIGPDTNGKEKVVEKWAQLDDNGFALMNITKDMPAGEYTIKKIRVHTTGEENSEQGFIAPINKPSLKITKTETYLSQFITFYPKIEYSQLTDEEKVVYKILDRLLLGNDTDNIISVSNPATNLVSLTKGSVLGTKLRYLGRGVIITDDIVYYLKQIGVGTTGTAGFTIPKRDILGFLKELRNDESYENSEFVRTLVNFKIFEYDGKVLDIGPEGSDGFIVISDLKILSHELVHFLDDLNEESRTTVVNEFNSLSPEDQVSYFLALCRIGYNNAFDSFNTITEWHAYTTKGTYKNQLFFEFYELAKKDFDASLIKFIEIDSGAKTSFVEEIFKSIKIHYDKDTKQFLITILEEDGTVIEEIKIDWETFKQIPSIIKKYYEKLLITHCKPSPSCSKAARDEILELLKVPASSFTGTKVFKEGEKKLGFYQDGKLLNPTIDPNAQVFASFPNVLPRNPVRAVVTGTITFFGPDRVKYTTVAYEGGIIIMHNPGDTTTSAATIAGMFAGSGLTLPGELTLNSVYTNWNVRARSLTIEGTDDQGNIYTINAKEGDLGKPTFATIENLANKTIEVALPDGEKITGTVFSDDGKTKAIEQANGQNVYIYGNGTGGMGRCTAGGDCQLYSPDGYPTWHIDKDGQVTNLADGWNGTNPFDAGRAYINISTGERYGQISGWVKDNQGIYHNGGYVWPNGDVSPSGMGYNMPQKEPKRYEPGKGPDDETNNIIIRAKGTFAGGAYPIMELQQGGKILQSWTVTSDFKDYTYIAASLGSDNLRVAFTNDFYDRKNADRNLDVDYLSINGKLYQSEDTYTTGTWTLSTGCAAGFKNSQSLDCNGYFEYPTVKAIKQ